MPDYDMGCKRITPSDTYLKAFNRDNVHLLTDKVPSKLILPLLQKKLQQNRHGFLPCFLKH